VEAKSSLALVRDGHERPLSFAEQAIGQRGSKTASFDVTPPQQGPETGAHIKTGVSRRSRNRWARKQQNGYERCNLKVLLSAWSNNARALSIHRHEPAQQRPFRMYGSH
jgi:hypothetical protein